MVCEPETIIRLFVLGLFTVPVKEHFDEKMWMLDRNSAWKYVLITMLNNVRDKVVLAGLNHPKGIYQERNSLLELNPIWQNIFKSRYKFVFESWQINKQSYSLNNNVTPSSPGFFPTAWRNVPITVYNKQSKHCKEWEREVLEAIKLEANGPEL